MKQNKSKTFERKLVFIWFKSGHCLRWNVEFPIRERERETGRGRYTYVYCLAYRRCDFSPINNNRSLLYWVRREGLTSQDPNMLCSIIPRWHRDDVCIYNQWYNGPYHYIALTHTKRVQKSPLHIMTDTEEHIEHHTRICYGGACVCAVVNNRKLNWSPLVVRIHTTQSTRQWN